MRILTLVQDRLIFLFRVVRYSPLILLLGCTQVYNKPEPGVHYVRITLGEDEDPGKHCSNHLKERDSRTKIKGCATPGPVCHVTLSRHSWESYAVHELAHCFMIYFH